jgi:hypothetical protein
MEVTFQLTADDFRHGMIAVRKRSRWRRWTYWFGFAVVVPIIIFGVTLLVAYPHSEIRQDSWIMLGGSVFWMVFIRTLPRLSARMQFRRTPSVQNPMTIAISESGLHVQSPHGDSQVAWSAYMGWGEEESVFVLLPQPLIYLPIPKRAFTEQQQAEFREALRRNIRPLRKT